MTQGRPTAAPTRFPYDHPNMAVVMAEEAHNRRAYDDAMGFQYRREYHPRERRSVAR